MIKFYKKISIHPLTYIMLLISLLSGLFKFVIIAFIIVLLHESGHIITSLLFKRSIDKVIILPFGGLIKMSSPISSIIIEDLLIAVSGIAMQLVIGIVIVILYQRNIIDYYLYQNIHFYNTVIISFNLLPLCPLDGYKIIKLLSEIIVPYKKTFIYSFILSIIVFICLLLNKINLFRENILVFMFIIVYTFIEFKNRNYCVLRFYIERLVNNFGFRKIIHINKIEKMYKNRMHIINGMNEKEYLKHYFR